MASFPIAQAHPISPSTFVHIRPFDGDCEDDSVLEEGYIIWKPGTWKDPGPTNRWDQKPGGHSRKVEGFSGHGGHHHGNPALRWHDRLLNAAPVTGLDYDAAIVMDTDADVRDGTERTTNLLTGDPEDGWDYNEGDEIRIPNCCGWRFSVVYVTVHTLPTGEVYKYVYVRRHEVNNWCVLQRPWPIFPSSAVATITGDGTGTIDLTYNGKYLEGSGSISCGATLYLQQGCHFGTGGGCTANFVGLRGSTDGVNYGPAAWALTSTCTCIPWFFDFYGMDTPEHAQPPLRDPLCSHFFVVVSE